MMSKRTMSPNSFIAARWASVPPIWPAPINAIFLRAIEFLSLFESAALPLRRRHAFAGELSSYRCTRSSQTFDARGSKPRSPRARRLRIVSGIKPLGAHAGPGLPGGARHGIDLAPEQARGQVHQEKRAFASLVEEGIELDQIERGLEPGLVQELHHQMRLPVGHAARNRGADAGRDRGIEKVDIEAHMQKAVMGLDPVDDAADRHREPILIEPAHVDD